MRISDGTVFEVAAGSGTITTLASFNGTNGDDPYGGLVEDSSGNLFGTTADGGANGDGTVFEVAAGSDTITTLVSFNGTNGTTPMAGLVEDSNGNLFGTTNRAASNNDGTVFEMEAAPAGSDQPDVVTWINSDGGDWDTPSNWVDQNGIHRVPGATDKAVIDISGITVTHNSPYADAVYSLTSQANIELSAGSLSLGAASTIAGQLTLDGGTLTGPGDLTVMSQFTAIGSTLSGTGTVYLDGPPIFRALELDQPLVNAGDAVLWEGDLDLGEGGSFTNQLGGTVELQQAFTVIGTGSFTNDGTLLVDNAIVSADENPTLSVFLTNQGLVHVETGELELSDGADSTGNFLGDAGTILSVGGDFTLEPGAMLSADTVTFAAGDDTVAGITRVTSVTSVSNAQLTFTNTSSAGLDGSYLSMSNSTLDLSAATPSSPLDFSNLDVDNGSTLTAPADIQVAGEFSAVAGTLDGSGTVTLDGTAYTHPRPGVGPTAGQRGRCGPVGWRPGPGGEGGSFTNQPGGTVELQQAFTVIGTGSFTNDGTLLVDNAIVSADENPTLSVFFTNQGRLTMKPVNWIWWTGATAPARSKATLAPSSCWRTTSRWKPAPVSTPTPWSSPAAPTPWPAVTRSPV